jgi:hypothetical protein
MSWILVLASYANSSIERRQIFEREKCAKTKELRKPESVAASTEGLL